MSNMSLNGKKIIILVENLYEDIELWYPYYRLIEEGATVLLVGSSSALDYKGKYGYPAKINLNVKEVKANEIDAILIPGGFAPDYLRRYEEVNTLVKNAFDKGKIIAAICHGPSVLINAGVLKNKKATCFMAIKADLINAGATFLDQEVVQDGNLITSRKPADLPIYCKTIINALKK